MTIWIPNLDQRRGPRYLAIADALEQEVAEGRLNPGDRLPPQRELAWALGVTLGTVSRGYAEAARRGLVGGQVGRGTYINAPNQAIAIEPQFVPSLGPSYQHPLAGSVAKLDATAHWFGVPGNAAAAIDLAPNYPAADGMADMMAAAIAQAGDPRRLAALVNYSHPGGLPEHRAAIARWLADQGIEADAETLLITPGCQGGLTAVFSALTRPGDTILCEALSWPGVVSFAWMRGLRARGVAMDRDGLIPDAFEEACARHRPSVAYLMPTVHNPTTAVLPEQRRQRLVEIAARYSVILIEDDVYGFLRPDAPPPLRAFAPDLAIYVSSLSKAVAPGLRTGYVVGPDGLMPRISAALRTTMLMGPSLQSELAMILINSGAAAEAADRQRAIARRRQTIAAAALGDLYDPAAGGNGAAFHIWLPLPDPWRVHDFVTATRARGVSVTPGDAFHVDPPGQEDSGTPGVAKNAVRLCLNGAGNDDDVRDGLAIVRDTLHQRVREALPVI